MKAKAKAKTNAVLRREAKELLAGQVHQYHYAEKEVEKASIDHIMGSGVILELTVLGGRELVKPVLIRDGLSKETIEAIQADLCRSYELATTFKPRGVK